MPLVALSNCQYKVSAELTLTFNDWQLDAGQRIFLHGPSGCGKSTFLNLLSGMLVPTSGKIHIGIDEFSSLSNSQRDKYRAQHIGVVFQQHNLIPYLSVADNIASAVHFAQRAKKRSQTPQHQHQQQRMLSLPESMPENMLNNMLDNMKLPKHILTQQASTLSIGQQQRVAIIRALINQPQLLLVDEPTSALDEDATDAFMQLLLEQHAQTQCGMVFVSHDKRLAQYFDHSVAFTDLVRAS